MQLTSDSLQIKNKAFPVQPIRSGETLELVTPCYEVWVKDQAAYGVLIKKNIRLMYLMNSLTGRYPTDTKFHPEDEPVFWVKKSAREALVKALEARNWPVGL